MPLFPIHARPETNDFLRAEAPSAEGPRMGESGPAPAMGIPKRWGWQRFPALWALIPLGASGTGCALPTNADSAFDETNAVTVTSSVETQSVSYSQSNGGACYGAYCQGGHGGSGGGQGGGCYGAFCTAGEGGSGEPGSSGQGGSGGSCYGAYCRGGEGGSAGNATGARGGEGGGCRGAFCTAGNGGRGEAAEDPWQKVATPPPSPPTPPHPPCAPGAICVFLP